MQEIRNYKKRRPISWQDKGTVKHIRNCYTFNPENNINARIKTAIAIYQALTEIESNKGGFNTFFASYNTIAKLAGVSYSTARRYCDDFIKIKVLHKKNIKNGKVNYANQWSLLEYAPMTFTSVQNNKQTLLCKVNNKADVSASNNKQSSIDNNSQPSVQNNSQE
jgi:hypothetical protein